MSNMYDPTYHRCIDHARTEIRALEAEKAVLERRLEYINNRQQHLRAAIYALAELLKCQEESG